ncbi:MAG: N-acetylmuramoyl-L-alanine amidase [Lachnospiraceae bacterium]
MTEQNGNKDEKSKSWEELRQSILEIEAAPYGEVLADYTQEPAISFDWQEEINKEFQEEEKKQEKKQKKQAAFVFRTDTKTKQKIQQNLVKTAICAAALLCTVGILKGVTGVVHAAYVQKQPQTQKISISQKLVQAVKAAQQKEIEEKQKARKEAEKKTIVPKDYTVCIDAGHGGKDRGCNVGSREEAEDTLILAKKLKKQLEDDGVKVIMTRDTDEYITLQQRVAIANDAKADYFVSLHRNQGDGTGVETWISSQPSDEAKTLGDNIHAGIIDVGVSRDRGLKQGSQSGAGNYYVIRCSQMPACIIELGFVNQAADNKNFDNKGDAYAKSIAEGIEKTAKAFDRDKPADDSKKKKEAQKTAEADNKQKAETVDATTVVKTDSTMTEATQTTMKKQNFDALSGK